MGAGHNGRLQSACHPDPFAQPCSDRNADTQSHPNQHTDTDTQSHPNGQPDAYALAITQSHTEQHTDTDVDALAITQSRSNGNTDPHAVGYTHCSTCGQSAADSRPDRDASACGRPGADRGEKLRWPGSAPDRSGRCRGHRQPAVATEKGLMPRTGVL